MNASDDPASDATVDVYWRVAYVTASDVLWELVERSPDGDDIPMPLTTSGDGLSDFARGVGLADGGELVPRRALRYEQKMRILECVEALDWVLGELDELAAARAEARETQALAAARRLTMRIASVVIGRDLIGDEAEAQGAAEDP